MASITDKLDEEGIFYKDKGNYILARCLSPEHEDIHPSFRINKVSGFGKCFSCGYTVNLLKVYNINSVIGDRIESLKSKLNNIILDTEMSYPQIVDPVYRHYRDISPKTLRKFGAFTSSTAGWEGRIWFPIRDIFGKTTSFYGRRIGSDADPKVIILPKGRVPEYIPAKPVIENGVIVLVEGIFDLLSLYDNGIINVCSTMGFPAKNDKRLESLKLHGVNRLILAYDGDEAGRAGSDRVKKLYSDLFTIDIFRLPDGHDWNSLGKDELSNQTKKLRALWQI